jgi:hypothetical protein
MGASKHNLRLQDVFANGFSMAGNVRVSFRSAIEQQKETVKVILPLCLSTTPQRHRADMELNLHALLT